MEDGNPASPLDEALAARIERLAASRARPPQPPVGGVGPRRPRRRHAAQRSRVAALSLSLVTTGGLTAAFAAGTTQLAAPQPAQPTGVVAAPTLGTSSTTSSTVASPVPQATTPTASALTAVNGEQFFNKYGPVQVQASFASDGSIASVDVLQFPSQDNKSIRINDQAIPILNQAAIVSQTAQVDSVSGATYTTTDYRLSLQSAVDAARTAGVTQLR